MKFLVPGHEIAGRVARVGGMAKKRVPAGTLNPPYNSTCNYNCKTL
ncbi:hypothetical protein [Achromobacter sp. Root83]|nr:hypothetical protein [Achromobacter sp. Root83]